VFFLVFGIAIGCVLVIIIDLLYKIYGRLQEKLN